MTRMLIRFLAAAAVVLMLSEPARPQGDSGAGGETARSQAAGVLAGHRFVSTTFIQDPFVRTYLRTSLGFGVTPELTTPPVTINGHPVTGVKGSLLFALMSFEYQYAIRDWIAVRGAYRVVGRLADEARPLLVQGVTLATGFELGWLFRLANAERTSLSGSLEVRNSSLTDVYLRRYIEGIIQDTAISPSNQLVEDTPYLQGGAGLSVAHAVSDAVGLTASATLYYGESVDRTEGDSWDYLIAAAVDFNLFDQGGPPIGFAVGGRTGSTPDISGAGSQTSQSIFGRIGYTGSPAFALGLDLAYDFVPIRNMEGKQNFLSGAVDIRLFF